MDDRQVRGAFTQLAYKFVETHYEPAVRDKIIASMDPAVVASIPKLSDTGWYPLEHFVSICDAIAKNRTLDQTEDEVRRLGQSIAEAALGTFLKLILKILTPALFANKYDSFWKRYHNFGGMHCDVTEIESNHIILYYPVYPWVHLIGPGWAETTFKAMGKPNVSTFTDLPRGLREASVKELATHVRW